MPLPHTHYSRGGLALFLHSLADRLVGELRPASTSHQTEGWQYAFQQEIETWIDRRPLDDASESQHDEEAKLILRGFVWYLLKMD